MMGMEDPILFKRNPYGCGGKDGRYKAQGELEDKIIGYLIGIVNFSF